MAISTASEPNPYVPAYNPVEYKFTSTNVDDCDFQFVADVYINGAFVTRLKAVPEEDGFRYGIFRIERLLQDYLSYDFKPTLSGVEENTNSLVTFSMQMRERYNTNSPCTGATTLSAVLTTTNTRRAYNGGIGFRDWPSFTYTDYLTGGTERKFLTNSPYRIKVPATDNFNLSFLNNPDNPATAAVILSYDRFNTLIETGVITVPAVVTSQNQSISVGPAQLASASYASGRGYHSNVHWYQVYLRNAGGDRITEIKEFEVDNRCSEIPYRIWWLNRLGGFDSIAVPLKRQRGVQIQRSLFEKKLAAVHALTDRGETVSSVDARESFQLNTNWLTPEEGLWIEEAFTSPEVFLHLPEETRTQSIEITGLQFRSNTVDFQLPSAITLPVGTTFTYTSPEADLLGASTTGTGTVTGHGSGYHQTDVVATTNVGASATGWLIAEVSTRDEMRVPIVITSTSYEEKTERIRYTIEARPSYKIITQNQ